MKKKNILTCHLKLVLILCTGLMLQAPGAFSQGCSDAGFCTINSIKNNEPDSIIGKKEYKNHLSFGISYGIGDFNIRIINPYLEYYRALSQKFSLAGRLYYLSASGSLTSVSGLSDFIFSASYSVNKRMKTTLGVKIPFNDGNLKSDGNPLPMNYQTSLGTFDLIAGYSFSYKNLGITFAMQQPLTQNNNQFLPGLGPAYGILYPSTYKFKRSGDVLFRASYSIPLLKDKLYLTPSLLPIYHLTNDRYTNEFNEEVEINGSKGLTINIVIFLQFTPSDRHKIELGFARPFVTRAARPDGLTRHYVVALEYKIFF
jgi:hypothetical protein